ncbi:MAG: Holliday junction resolvase RuvX [Acidobacteriia bacterium]|nr:Holliday junction resolvase RuvX [Terriglobia bacterium]
MVADALARIRRCSSSASSCRCGSPTACCTRSNSAASCSVSGSASPRLLAIPSPIGTAAYNIAVSGQQHPTSSSLDQPVHLPHARILGLDVGSKTIGMAVSDPLGITAQGLETIRRKNKRTDFELLERAIREHDVREIVVGFPLRMSGQEGRQAEKVSAFADRLRARFQLPVHLWDERLTSVQANRLLREAELSIAKRAAAVDRMAAVLILQSYLDAHARV